jgi:hypothetical protein
MGDIYRATDSTLGRVVAIKVLAHRYADDQGIRERFMREALAAARLSGQRHTVMIFDVGEHRGRPYMVMEYLGGGSLDGVLRDQGAQPPERAFRWLEQAAQALDAAHDHGVVHRDVKPANLLLDEEGNVHVADFGIASAAGLSSLTLTGTVIGTAGYLSPEQARGDRATAASDRYALAVVAFELLTGKRPFASTSPTAEAAAHVNAEIPSVSGQRDGLPRELDPVFERALAKDPLRRYASSAEFVAALRDAVSDAAGDTRELRAAAPVEPATTIPRPPRDRSQSTWAVLFGLLLLGALAGAFLAFWLTRGQSPRHVAHPPRATTVVRTVTSPNGGTTAAPVPAGVGPHALNDEGYAKMQAGDYNGALPLLQQAVAGLRGRGPGDPYEAFANYNLGYTLLRLGRCNEAIPYLKAARRLEPQRVEPGRALARAKACK